MAREAPERIRDLLGFGVPFDKDLEGRLTVGREAAHSARRIVHVRGDQAGRAIMAALVAAVRKTPRIRVLEGYVAEDLITEGGRVTGVVARDRDGRLANIPARAIVLASGGLGHLFAVTTNPIEARGQGLAIAARAGAVIADPEFVQFHPTAIDIGRDPAPLATEAIRGEGATLVNRAGERFMLQDPSPRPSSRRATSWRARCSPSCRPGAARSSTPARRSARLRRALPRRRRILPRRRHRSGARPDPGRAGRALSHGRRRDRRERAHLARRPVGGRRSRLDRRAWRQPPRVELAARSRGLCGAHRRGHRRAAAAVAAARPATAPRGANTAVTDAGARTGAAPADVGACRRRAQRRRPEARAARDRPTSSATPRTCRSCATWRPPRC